MLVTFCISQLTCDQNDAAGNNRTTREKKWESEKRRVGQMETGMQRKRAREREGLIAFFRGFWVGHVFIQSQFRVKTNHTSVHLPYSVTPLWIHFPHSVLGLIFFIPRVFMLLLYNRFLSLLESIYRRGARRWRKLYRVNGHLFQAKRFNRVS